MIILKQALIQEIKILIIPKKKKKKKNHNFQIPLREHFIGMQTFSHLEILRYTYQRDF